MPRDMAQLVTCQAHKHNSNPPTHVKSLSEQLPFITSGLGKQRQEDPGSSLASQSSPMDELQVLQEMYMLWHMSYPYTQINRISVIIKNKIK